MQRPLDPTYQQSRYEDHVGLWEHELRAWVPERIFDAHVHLGPPGIVRPPTPERLRDPLTTFTALPWEELLAWYAGLFSGKTLEGVFAFGFPLQEVDIAAANAYLRDLMAAEPRVTGFILADPGDPQAVVRTYAHAERRGVRFRGVKPYYDYLGKSNYGTRMEELLPPDLLEFMDRERLVLMLHTCGIGVGDPAVQDYLKWIGDRYANLPVVLAHMGRYLEVEQFLSFCDSGVLTCPSLYLEMSSASRPEVYQRALEDHSLWGRLLFGSDLPFGLITGVEYPSPETGTVFLTRDDYLWSDQDLKARFAPARLSLTYNTYHTINALKSAVEALEISPEDREELKRDIFARNAQGLLRGLP
jgi:hypothetical protein